DKPILERAYNDAQGVTAQFNLNLLRRANRELGTNFRLEDWRHRAIYASEAGGIAMYLINECDQTIHLVDHEFHFRPGEKIITEFSYKYTPEGFSALAAQVGFRPVQMWTDRARLFGVFYLDVSS